MRPRVKFLQRELVEKITSEARDVLREIGVSVACEEARDLLLAGGASSDSEGRLKISDVMIDRALSEVPDSFALYDRDGQKSAELGGMNVHFTPGSTAIYILDAEDGRIRRPNTADYIRYVRLVHELDAIDYQSTAMIPCDVHEQISDSYRLYLSLIYGSSPVVTGAFTIEAFAVMRDLLLAVRGSKQALADKPLAIFSCCPTAPLKWSDVTAQNLIDCARHGIPVEYISVPLTGFIAPGTLVGSLIQHTAENLSGLVISHLAAPGVPALWGGSPAVFDYRYETTPVGATESQMLCCAHSQIGKYLNIPTQAYIGLSDAKSLDAQAGLESSAGAILAVLAGINSISGPGMLDFESCISLEKLVLDQDICAASKRVIQGIEVRDGDFPSSGHFRDLLREGHSLIASHTRKHFRKDVRFPSSLIERSNRQRFIAEGAKSLSERARLRVQELLQRPLRCIDNQRRALLDEVMLAAARTFGMNQLPPHDDALPKP